MIDRSSPVPLYFQVATRIQQLIEDGSLPLGTRLENEILLAQQLRISRPTMRRAIQYLVDRGMVVRKRGVGTQIVRPTVRRLVELSSLYDDLLKAGRSARTEILSLEVVPATPAVAQALGVVAGTEITWIERLRSADGEPIALMSNAVPLEVLPIRRADLDDHGLYELLRRAGRIPRTANQTIGATAASAAQARTLHEIRGAPLLTMTRTAWDESGRAIEYGSHVYPASRYSFELTLTGD
jgi:DNA-binding GntR family transcriptional regulator